MGSKTYGRSADLAKAIALFFIVLIGCVPATAQDMSEDTRDEPVTILALGDSLTQGYGLPEADGFVPQLQNWLAGQSIQARVINGGVSGDTTAGGLARVEWSLSDGIDAMIVTLGGNDLLRGIAPEIARANIEGILQVAQRRNIRVLLIGMEAPGNFGPAYKTRFDALYPDLAAQYQTLFAPSFFAGLPTSKHSLQDLKPFMQDDGIHPNAEGVRLIVQELGPYVLRLVTETN